MSTGAVSVPLVTAAIACWLAIGGGQASAAQVSCGDTITTDTTLHHDLVNCPNNGIVIGADDVTLDLNGYTIDGDGTEFSGCDPTAEVCDAGVVNDGYNGVTVRHGRVRQFLGDVLFGTSSAGRIRHNRVLNISATHSELFGIGIFSSIRTLVRNSSGNGSTGQEDASGMFLGDVRHVRVVHNAFRHNDHVGLLILAPATKSSIKGNHLSRNREEAMLIEGGEGLSVKGNRLVRNGAGITLGPGSGNAITRNRVRGGRDGIRVEKGHGNLIAHNLVVHPRRAGIRLGIKHPFLGGAHNVVRRNRVRDSRVDGFVVVKKERHSLLNRNVAKGSGDDGFDIESSSTTLTSNRAVNNGDLGINAVLGVNDGGGNRAHGNGNPLQCLNIVCD
jgi:large repetitive protein